MTDFVVVIPARLEAERLPRKPLLDIAGRTMIERVHARATASRAGRVIVATDSSEIGAAVRAFGGEVALTSPAHASGTDRIAEVAAREGFADDTIVVNVQGDEPLIAPALIDRGPAGRRCPGRHRDTHDAAHRARRIHRSEHGPGRDGP